MASPPSPGLEFWTPGVCSTTLMLSQTQSFCHTVAVGLVGFGQVGHHGFLDELGHLFEALGHVFIKGGQVSTEG